MALSVPDVNAPLFGSDSHRKPELEQLILEKYAASFAHIVYVTHKQYGPRASTEQSWSQWPLGNKFSLETEHLVILETKLGFF